jgi:hypothetical protein
VYYQYENAQHKEVGDYDYYTGSTKRVVETFRVNYLNGKLEEVKTDFVLSQTTTTRILKDEKGKLSLLYLGGTKQFQKDKTLSPERNVILNERLKEVADVSGINLPNAKPFGEKYWTIGSTVYDSKLKEVGYLESPLSESAKRVADVDGAYGLYDYTGKYIINPTWTAGGKMGFGEYYFFSSNKVAKLFKVENEKATEVGSLNLEKYQIINSTGSDAHFIIEETETSTNKIADLTTGAISDFVEPGATDWDVSLGNGVTTYGGTLKYASHLYRVGTSYFAITSETRMTLSYANVK